jgi:hypothetical protein
VSGIDPGVARAILTRLSTLTTAIGDATTAVENDDKLTLKMAIRDMGFFVFAMDQHYNRMPIGDEDEPSTSLV